MGNHVQAIVAARVSFVRSEQEKRQGRPPAVLVANFSVLLFVNGFLQLGPRGKLRDLPGSDFNRGASLRIAPVPRLSLRYRESAKTYQCHPIPFPQSTRNAAHGSVNRSCSLRFAHFASTSDLVNQICLIHSFSSQVSFIPSTVPGGQKARV
jgi:hypothetical protein